MNQSLAASLWGPPAHAFEPLDNDVVRVEAVGRTIRVGIKDGGVEVSWIEPAYPFSPQPFDLPLQRGWKVTVAIDGPAVQTITFEKADRRHVLTLRVTDPDARPLPVEVRWE